MPASVEQFQCDQGVGPTYDFAIESNGTLTSSGSSIFYACPASDIEWNLYTTPVVGQKKCVEIILTASGCSAEASTSAIQSVTTVTVFQDCGVPSSTAPAIIFSFTSSPQGVIETSTSGQSVIPPSHSGPAFSTTTHQASSAVSSPEGITSSTESTSVVASSSPSTPEVSSVETASTPIQESTTVPVIQSSSLASIVPSSAVSLTTYPHSVVSPSSIVETPTVSALVSPVTSVESESSTPAGTTVIASVGGTSKVYPTTKPYANTTASSAASSTSSASGCVSTTLTGSDTSGNYQYPHLIIPISSTSPTTAYGTQYFGTISSNVSTIFNFDIPSSYSGSTCNLIFLLPLQSELETSSYTYSGTGVIDFEQLSSAATSTTTYDNAPSVEKDLGEFDITEGSSTLIESFECPAGGTLTYELKAVGDTYLYYFQDWNPSPIGLFITYC